jgi:hypothetical protein
MFFSWIHALRQQLSKWRSLRRRPSLNARGKVRINVRPPALQPWFNSDSGMGSQMGSSWLDSTPYAALDEKPRSRLVSLRPRHITPLPAIRSEFLSSLQDLPGQATVELESRIRGSRSLRELWHLRSELFKLVAVHRDQRSAQERLARLNRHFPSEVLGRVSTSMGLPLRTAP